MVTRSLRPCRALAARCTALLPLAWRKVAPVIAGPELRTPPGSPNLHAAVPALSARSSTCAVLCSAAHALLHPGRATRARAANRASSALHTALLASGCLPPHGSRICRTRAHSSVLRHATPPLQRRPSRPALARSRAAPPYSLSSGLRAPAHPAPARASTARFAPAHRLPPLRCSLHLLRAFRV
jgi:hypothetical protein